MRILSALLLAWFLGGPTTESWAEDRKGHWAFLVGIDNYDKVPKLQSAISDVRAARQTLISPDVGYRDADVTPLEDATQSQFTIKWQSFLDRVAASKATGGVVFFYFAGHGVELKGENFLLPRDLPELDQADQTQLRKGAIDLQHLLGQFGDLQSRKDGLVGIFVIDACRDNPYFFNAKTGTDEVLANTVKIGLGPMRPPINVFITYSAGIGQKAIDGGTSGNSLFNEGLLPLLRLNPTLDVADIVQSLRFKVSQAAQKITIDGRPHEQTPAYYDQLPYRLDI